MMKRLVLCMILAIISPTQDVVCAESAKAHIDGLGREAIETLTSGSLGESAQREQFLSLLDRGFDVPSIAKYVMGKHWASLSADQQDHFVSKFRNDLSRQYANRFKEYRGVTFSIKGARETGDGGYFVQSSLIKPGQTAGTAVEWKVYSGKILDVKVEGVSMSQTKRDETYAAIQASGGDAGRYAMGGGAGGAPGLRVATGPAIDRSPENDADRDED